jgi:hypothetical protein
MTVVVSVLPLAIDGVGVCSGDSLPSSELASILATEPALSSEVTSIVADCPTL